MRDKMVRTRSWVSAYVDGPAYARESPYWHLLRLRRARASKPVRFGHKLVVNESSFNKNMYETDRFIRACNANGGDLTDED